jgi:hypothetical protein
VLHLATSALKASYQSNSSKYRHCRQFSDRMCSYNTESLTVR